MQSPSRCGNRSSTDAAALGVSVGAWVSRNARGILVACTVGAALVGALGLAFGEAAVAGGLVASTAFFGPSRST